MNNGNPEKRRFEELCAGYVLNVLDPEENREFEAMLSKASDKQKQLYRDLWATANQLSFAVEGSEPSEKAREELLNLIRKEDSEAVTKAEPPAISAGDETPGEPTGEKDSGWSPVATAVVFALAVICLSLLLYTLNLHRQLNDAEELATEQQRTIASLKSEIQDREQYLSVLESPDLSVIHLRGMESSPGASGKIIYSSNNSGELLLQASNLPASPVDATYQLWVVRDNEFFSAGTFHSGEEEKVFFLADQDSEINVSPDDTFAITLEPGEGSVQPTGETYLMSIR